MSEALRKQVGGRLKELREARGLTQAQLAHLLGKSWETISNFERGKTLPSLVTLEQVAGVLGLSMREFFDDRPVQRSTGQLDALMAQMATLSEKERSLVLELAKTIQQHNLAGRS